MKALLLRSHRRAIRWAWAATCGWLSVAVAATLAQEPCSTVEQAKLIASGAAANDQFGISVALSGDTVVVGAYLDDYPGGNNQGSAYVFTPIGGVWTLQQMLIASDAATGDRFGFSVAVSGDTSLVGAVNDSHAGGNWAGSVYAFERANGAWTEQQKLTASDAAVSDTFGVSVALSGDTAVIGAYVDDQAGGTDAGSAYVFTRTDGLWTQQQKLSASDAAEDDYFGVSVAVFGDTAVVGAPGDDHTGGMDAGSAYVFIRAGGVWIEQQKLIASDAAAGDEFGYPVAVSGDTAIVGANGDDTASTVNAGSAYVFTGSGGIWIQQQKLTASYVAAYDLFGASVALSGDTAVVGAYGSDFPGRINAGSAYLFTRTGGAWAQRQKLTASDGAAHDLFGFTVALSGDMAVVGAYLDDHAGAADAGSSYVFDLSDYDGDGVFNLSDVCPFTAGGCAVDAQGRPLFDRNDDCVVNGLDIEILVGEILMGTGWDIAAAVDDLLRTCSPCG